MNFFSGNILLRFDTRSVYNAPALCGGLMENVLVVSKTEKGISVIMELLYHNSYSEIIALQSGGDARRLLLERSFDLCIINAPLGDEFGDALAVDIVSKSACQVVLIVSNSVFEQISSEVELAGVLTISKPVDKNVFWNSLKLAKASYYKMSMLKEENEKLQERIKEIRLVDRAKCILIEYLKMTEPEAHRYIERQAMDLRITKLAVAERILKTYES